jgi:hypothetical protein
MEDYVAGRFMSGVPKHVFLFGDATSLPLPMAEGPSWYQDLNRITTLDFATIINQMGNVLHFSGRQWKWLAETYGLKLEDQSTERRRYGRWGAPGKEKNLKPTALENIVLPPAPQVADPIVVQPKAPTAPANAPKVEVEPIKAEPIKPEIPQSPKADAPVAEKAAVPMTVTVTPDAAKPVPAKPEPPTVDAPVFEKPVTAPAAAPITK